MLIEKKIKFNADKKLRIMQVSDAQDMHIIRPEMFRMLAYAYDTYKPDLVILAGDNILGNHIDDMPIGSKHPKRTKSFTEKRIRKALDYLLSPLEKRGIPFTFVYGNHDCMNALSEREQAAIYAEYGCFFGLNEDEDISCDTFNFPLYSHDGRMIYNIWMMNSAGKYKNGHRYIGVQKKSLDWYEKRANELKEQNGGEYVRSLMFQHVPFPESRELFKVCSRENPGAAHDGNGRHYRLDTEKAKGIAYEYDFEEQDTHQLETIKRVGDVDAVVSAHLHINAFDGVVDGVRVIESPGASFRCYGLPYTRGIRIFDFNEDDPSAFTTQVITYFEMFGENFSSKFRYFMNADEMEKKKNLALTVTGAALVGGAIAASKIIKKKIK